MSSSPPNPFSDPYGEPKPNPYQSPDFAEKPAFANPGGGNELNSSILTQQRVVAILMIVQGSVSTLAGLFFAGIAVVVPMVLEMDQRNNNNFNGGGPPPELRWIMMAAYGAMSMCALIPGCLQIYAGIQGWKLRRHKFAIVALAAGVLTIMTCYCFPTSLALLIYGLIIYLHDTTKRAFQLAEEGRTFDEIMAMATQRRF